MTRTVPLLLSMAFTAQLHAQPPALTWKRSMGGSVEDMARAMTTLPGGGSIVVGGSRSSNGDVGQNQGAEDLWAVRLDADGTPLWNVTYGGSGNDRANAVDLMLDGGFILAGETGSTNGDVQPGTNGSYDYWVVRLDALGQLVWQRTLGGTASDNAKGVRSTPDGGAIVIGTSASNNGDITTPWAFNDIWVVKLDAAGDQEWQKSYGSMSNDEGTAIIATADGGYLFTGTSSGVDGDVSGQNGQGDMLVCKIDAGGSIQWLELFGGSQLDIGTDLIEMADGSFVVVGSTQSTNGDVGGSQPGFGQELWVVKISATGTLIHERNFGGLGAEAGVGLAPATNGGIVAVGRSNGNSGDVTHNQGGFDLWALEVSASGDLVWQVTYGGSGYETASCVGATSDGGYIIAGYTDSNDGDVLDAQGGYDLWALKLGGGSTAIKTEEQRSIHIWPNPADQQLYLGDVRAGAPYSIQTMTGNLVRQGTITSEPIDISRLPVGTYVLMLTDGGMAPVRFVVLR